MRPTLNETANETAKAEVPALNQQEQIAAIELELKQLELQERRNSLELRKHELAKFDEEKEERKRILRVRLQAIAKNEEDKRRMQAMCKHLSGGDGSRNGKMGFFQGDGDRMGACVNDQTLPTGERYRLCLRCQKEWHHPEWQVRIEIATLGHTSMTKTQYNQQLKEYLEAVSWSNKGKFGCESSLFKIPMLDDAIDSKKGIASVKFAEESPAINSMV